MPGAHCQAPDALALQVHRGPERVAGRRGHLRGPVPSLEDTGERFLGEFFSLADIAHDEVEPAGEPRVLGPEELLEAERAPGGSWHQT